MTVVTRFAPSPTGYLHIGSARTALFNYLFAKHYGGKFLLRIEDTDRQRSTDEAIEAILIGMKWLGLDWDEKEIYQFSRLKRHAEVAYNLLEKGKAYKCYLTPNELEKLREESRKTGLPIRSPWRDEAKDLTDDTKPYALRIKFPREGVTIVDDIIQGEVVTGNAILDDLVLLRSDGTPTYNLAVVVDDHDMGVTHIIRGDDHLNNAAKQQLIYQAMGWDLPKFAHIPLIHGEDGAKLSKRHGALGVMEYKEMGYLPETINNYLLRLGWGHGNEEIIAKEKAIELFNLDGVGKSPSRMDFKKLDNLNAHYIKIADNSRLLELICANNELTKQSSVNVLAGIHLIKERSKTIIEMRELAKLFYTDIEMEFTPDLTAIISQKKEIYSELAALFAEHQDWGRDSLMSLTKEFAAIKTLKINDVVIPFRIALTASNASPSIFDIMEIVGKKESMRRIGKFL